MADYDDFFDSPRQNVVETSSSKSSHAVDADITIRKNFRADENSHKPVGKPPTHPNSRPVSATNRTPTSPGVFERSATDSPQAHGSRCVIEAKVPYDDGGSYSDDSFIGEDDGGPSADEDSGRRSPIPRRDKPDQKLMLKEMHVPGRDASPLVTENSARELSDYSDNYSDVTDSDNDSDVIDVSPLNTPHSPKIQTASACSSSPSKNISRSSNREPVRLLHGDRDSLDLDVLLQTVHQMEKQGRSQSRQTQLATSTTSRGSRVNYSFTNEQVNAIDKENRRLMASIMRHANASKKAKAKANKRPTSVASTIKRPSSAAVNRAKQQQKIEAENLMLLRRLQQTRPTKELRRDVLSGSGQGGFTQRARPGSSMRQRPTSAQRSPCTSRPMTAFPRQPDDDDVLTWQPDDF